MHTSGGSLSINSDRSKKSPRQRVPLALAGGDFFTRGHIMMATASMPILPTPPRYLSKFVSTPLFYAPFFLLFLRVLLERSQKAKVYII